jgi:RNA polymerase sigma-70 factor (ECF subfamily)
MEPEPRFRALFLRAYPALGRYAHYRGLSQSDAEDLVSSTLEVAWRKLNQVPLDDPLPWLYAVARNLLRNNRRSEHRSAALLQRLPIPEPHPAPSEPYDPGVGAFREALAALDENDQEILSLVAWDGLSPSQAAVVLGCTAVAARTRLHRARKRLAAQLEHEAPVQPQGPGGQLRDDTYKPISPAEVSDA